MTSPHPRVLGVHAIASDGDWLADGLAVRILSHPRLGFPLGPLSVTIEGLGEHPEAQQAAMVGSGRGWRGNGEVDGTAWIRLVSTSGDPRTPISVRLNGSFDPGTRITVVRAPFDLGEGILSVSAEPYTLWAPRVTHLRIDGRCQIAEVAVSYPEPNLTDGPSVAMGLPFGRIGGQLRPKYVGHDPTGVAAMERVRRGAPRRPGPHELEADGAVDPADAEEARVKGLVFDGGTDVPLADELAALIGTPQPQRHVAVAISDLIANSPQATAGTRRRLEGIMAAAGDPGIARWLGLAGTFDHPGANVLTVTVAGRWILPRSLWADWVRASQDEDTARRLLEAAGVGDQFGGSFADLRSAYLWTQAQIDLTVRPDPPRPPALRANPAGVWIERVGRDVVRLPIAFEGVAPIAQGALVRTEGGADVGVLPASPGDASRVRPLLVRDGTGVDLIADPPRDDGQYAFAGWQADMFGRWSDRSADAAITSPPRPGLPEPEPQWRHDLAQPGPVGENPYAQSVEVRVPVPRRRAGEPAITDVGVALGGSVAHEPARQPGVTTTVPGPALGRGQETDTTLVVTFTGDDGTTRSADPIRISFVDPRPPFPPPRDPVLRFASPPDRHGISGYAIPLPAGQGITGWRVFATTESRLVAAAAADGLAAPDPALSRDERASRWLAQQTVLKPSRFDCLTASPVVSGEFGGTLPGTSADLLFLRPVPQRGGVEPPFARCPMVAVAVPRAAGPAMPELSLDRTVTPSVLTITTHPGTVAADHYRLRLATTVAGDPRTAVIVAEGALAGAVTTLPAPELRPFARAWVMAEVRAVAEAGIGSVPVRWSASSPPVELHRIAAAAPVIATPPIVTAGAGGVTVTVALPGIAHAPVPGPYEVRLYERVAGGPWTAKDMAAVSGEDGTITFTPAAGADYQVLVADPLGRRSAPAAIAIP